jgi:hypothetical protein
MVILRPFYLNNILSRVYTYGTQPTGKDIGSGSTKSSSVGQSDRGNLLDPANKHNTPAQFWVAGSASMTNLAGYEIGGKLIHKFIKAAQCTQVSWRNHEDYLSTGLMQNHHERLRYYERVAWSRINIMSDDLPGTWPWKQRIRPVIVDKQDTPRTTRWATALRHDLGSLGEPGDVANDSTLCTIVPKL